MNNLSAGGVFSEFPEEFFNEIIRLIKTGQKIPAIRLFRNRTGAGLKESKDAVDKISKEV